MLKNLDMFRLRGASTVTKRELFDGSRFIPKGIETPNTLLPSGTRVFTGFSNLPELGLESAREMVYIVTFTLAL